MRWRKLGHVFSVDRQAPWMLSHAANPVAEQIEAELHRIYFSTRDRDNRSSIAWVEVDLRRPTEVLRIAQAPVAGPGAPGAFDDSGASMGCLVRAGDMRFLYYLGWNLGVTVPWRNSIGLLTSRGGADFERHSPAPLLDRGHHDPFSISYPWVLREESRWRMWYGSNLRWGKEQKDMAHVIKYAQSDDGLRWEREGRVALDFKSADEYAFSKPCIVRDAPGRYRMWYSYRGERYRIGYAESGDALEWQRRDERVGIEPSASGWDGEAVCYPCVFDCGGQRYMLYNGNGYGRTGFGMAILDA